MPVKRLWRLTSLYLFQTISWCLSSGIQGDKRFGADITRKLRNVNDLFDLRSTGRSNDHSAISELADFTRDRRHHLLLDLASVLARSPDQCLQIGRSGNADCAYQGSDYPNGSHCKHWYLLDLLVNCNGKMSYLYGPILYMILREIVWQTPDQRGIPVCSVVSAKSICT